eukprot:PhM_4_TR3041/c1_g1_i1/m.45300
MSEVVATVRVSLCLMLPFLIIVSATTQCNFGAFKNYGTKGTCHKLYLADQANTVDKFVTPFDSTNAPDLLSSDASNVNPEKFTITVSEDLCHIFSVDVGSTALTVQANTQSSLVLTGAASLSQYYSVISQIKVRTCNDF